MKKVVILTVLIMLFGNLAHASDYSAQLSELQDLLDKCAEKNILVPYETVGVKTFERFTKYLAEDEENGVDASIMEYNDNAMQNIYTQTKSSLEKILSGEKAPLKVPEYNMMNTKISGMGMTDGENDVISTGYGHFQTAKDDIENLHDFGMMNLQTQMGMKHITALPEWSFSTVGEAECYHDIVEEDDNRCLKVVYKSEKANNNYFLIRQNVNVKPSTRYYYGVKLKGTDVSKNACAVRVNGTNNYIATVGDTWNSSPFTFVTDEDDTQIRFDIYVDGKCGEVYIDDAFIKEGTTGANLLLNGDFESLYSQKNLDKIPNELDRAEQSNVAVSFLLQPMYFWRIPDCEDMYYGSSGTDYNVNDKRAKAKIEEYLRIIIPIIAEHDAVRDICITNEPSFDTRKFQDYYSPKFREYLLKIYGSLENINRLWNTSYTSIDNILMPAEASKTAIFYDWICFNEDVYTEWHKWIAEIIREYTDKPLHSKMMTYMSPAEYDDRRHLIIGTDAEKFGEFLDYAGNDSYSVTTWEATMINEMMWYDYLYSVVGKPIYNSEDHMITDGDEEYNDKQKNNIRYSLWQGAIHGRSMSTMWVWERSYDETSDFYGSILHRPDCVTEAGYTSLDMMRLSDDIIKLSSKKPEVALFYSKTSRVFNDDYQNILTNYYKGLLFSGKRVGFVSETSLDKLSEYKYLVIPSVSHTTLETLDAIENFIANGGKVIYYGDCMKYDKCGKALDNSALTSNATKLTARWADGVRTVMLDYFADERVRIIDNATGEPVKNVEFVYELNDNELLLNLVAHSFDADLNISVYLDGEKLNEMENLQTNEIGTDSYNLKGYVPLMIKKEFNEHIPKAVTNLEYKNGIISWAGDENSAYYNVYYKGAYGEQTLYMETEESMCKALKDGVYTIVPINKNGVFGASTEFALDTAFEISFNEINRSDNGFTVSVRVVNTAPYFKNAVIKIKNSDAKTAVSDIWLAPMQSTDFTASFIGFSDCVWAGVGSDINNQSVEILSR